MGWMSLVFKFDSRVMGLASSFEFWNVKSIFSMTSSCVVDAQLVILVCQFNFAEL